MDFDKAAIEEMKRLINQLDLPNDELGYDDETDNLCIYESELQEMRPTSEIYFGASKMAIVDKELPFVLKIPFNGQFIACPPLGKYRPFLHFTHASPIKEYRNNYAEAEYQTYLLAKKLHVNQFFAETTSAGTVCNGIPIYAQEKVEIFLHKENKLDINYLTYIRVEEIIAELQLEDENLGYDNNRNWFALALEKYGEAAFRDFLVFLSQNYTIAEDLHAMNLGIRADGTPCILDFSGFND